MSNSEVTRRGFLHQVGVGTAAAAAVTAVAAPAAQAAEAGAKIKIVGVSTSLRKGKTTAAAVQRVLDAAKAVAPERIEIELIELAGLKMPVEILVGGTLEPGERDDFPAIAEKLSPPEVAGIIVGTPTYFANMSSLCKAFLERWQVFRKNDFCLSNKVGGVLATGGSPRRRTRTDDPVGPGRADGPGDDYHRRRPPQCTLWSRAVEPRRRHQPGRDRPESRRQPGPPRRGIGVADGRRSRLTIQLATKAQSQRTPDR